ncbi:MAG TPA: ribokinase [Ruminiclostridium sp.]
MKNPVISIVGSYAVALTMMTKRFPTSGETLMGENFKQFHGGKGSNQAVESARLGANVNFVACIGKDGFGKGAINLYKTEGINTNYITESDNLSTGVGFIIVDEQGHNIITLDLGANLDLNPDYVNLMKDSIIVSDVLLMQLEISTQSVVAAAKIAKENGVKVILNPAPYQPLPDDIWEDIYILTPNEKEAKLILGYDPESEIAIQELADGIIKKGVKNVIITLGGRGAYFATSSYSNKYQLIPARKVDVVDTTGAGDTFSAALGVAIGEGKALSESVQFASAAASLSVTKYGVIEAMPYRNQVDKLMSSNLSNI